LELHADEIAQKKYIGEKIKIDTKKPALAVSITPSAKKTTLQVENPKTE